MAWFKKEIPQTPTTTIVEKKAAVEIVAHKKATKKQIEATKRVSENLNKLLEANGFTLKIYLASRPDKRLLKSK